MSVPQETDVRAAASFSKLIQLTSVATHWTARTDATEPGTLAQDTLCMCRGCVCVGGGATWRLTSLVVDMERSSLVHPGHHLVIGAVEAVDLDHAGFWLHVSVVRVGGVQVVLKHSQPVEVLDLLGTNVRAVSRKEASVHCSKPKTDTHSVTALHVFRHDVCAVGAAVRVKTHEFRVRV